MQSVQRENLADILRVIQSVRTVDDLARQAKRIWSLLGNFIDIKYQTDQADDNIHTHVPGFRINKNENECTYLRSPSKAVYINSPRARLVPTPIVDRPLDRKVFIGKQAKDSQNTQSSQKIVYEEVQRQTTLPSLMSNLKLNIMIGFSAVKRNRLGPASFIPKKSSVNLGVYSRQDQSRLKSYTNQNPNDITPEFSFIQSQDNDVDANWSKFNSTKQNFLS